jgi:hypothetical protein
MSHLSSRLRSDELYVASILKVEEYFRIDRAHLSS